VISLEARLDMPHEAAALVSQAASLFGQVERACFREMYVRGRPVTEVKSEFIRKYAITARQFNAVRVFVQGKVKAAQTALIRNRDTTRRRLAARENLLRKLTGQEVTGAKRKRRLHELRRQIHALRGRLKRTEVRLTEPVPPLAFGSVRLFRKQFELEANGYASHDAWKADWQRARSSSFFLLGSKDETCGNQSCQLRDLDEDGNATLKLRLPDAMIAPGGSKYLQLPIRFGYRTNLLSGAMQQGRALSFRFVSRSKSHRTTGRPKGPWRWYVQVSFEPDYPDAVSPAPGALGIDLNKDMLALAHVDGSGNPVRVWQEPLLTTDRRSAQVKDAAGVAALKIVAYAKEHGVAIVVEKLDFTKKKADAVRSGIRYRRMLSGLAYAAIGSTLRSRAAREGVEVREVNPAFTSVIGEVKFAGGYGISRHSAAAVVMARRSMGMGERLRGRLFLPSRIRSATPLPVRNRGVHVWRDWGRYAAARKKQQLAERERARSATLTACRTSSDRVIQCDRCSAPLALDLRPKSGCESPGPARSTVRRALRTCPICP
jgi:IS605 OrfB family transposase